MTRKMFKIVVVGDGACGKTSLINAHSGGEFFDGYTPTAFDDYAIEALVDGKMKTLTVCDTAGEDDYNNLRPLSYPDADVFLVCYTVERPESLKNVEEKWIPEIRRFCPDTPIVLVGNKKDILDEPARKRSLIAAGGYVEFTDADRTARTYSTKAVECSAKTREGVRQVFETAIREAQARRNRKQNRVLGSIMKLKLVF